MSERILRGRERKERVRENKREDKGERERQHEGERGNKRHDKGEREKTNDTTKEREGGEGEGVRGVHVPQISRSE